MKKKLIAFFLVLSMMLSVFAGCSSKEKTHGAGSEKVSESKSEKSEPIKMKIGIGYHLGCALFFIAEEAGYFEDYGLEVEMVPFDSSSDALAAMRKGELDCADFGASAVFSLAAQGAEDVRIFGGQMHEGSGIICLPENEERFSDFANFKGTKLGLVPMSTGDVVYRYGLAKAGLTYGLEGSGADVTIVELDSAATVIEAVKKGEIDCGGVWIPQLANAASQGLSVCKLSGEVIPNHP